MINSVSNNPNADFSNLTLSFIPQNKPFVNMPKIHLHNFPLLTYLKIFCFPQRKFNVDMDKIKISVL